MLKRLCNTLLAALIPIIYTSCKSTKGGKAGDEPSFGTQAKAQRQIVVDNHFDDDDDDDDDDDEGALESFAEKRRKVENARQVEAVRRQKEKEEADAPRIQRAKEMYKAGADIETITCEFQNRKPNSMPRNWPYAKPLVRYEKLIEAMNDTLIDDLRVRELLKSEIDINEPDSYGNLPLDYAIEARNMKIVRMMWELGADVNGNGTQSPVRRAVSSGSMEILRFLVEKGADLLKAAKEKNSHLVLAAARKETTEMLKYLLSKGLPPDLRSADGTTALMFVDGGTEAIDILLEAGADPKAMSADGRTPMGNAIEFGDYAKVLKLMEHGVKCDSPHLLHLAARHGDIEMVRKLLESGMAVNGYSMQAECTPLFNVFPSPDGVATEKSEAVARFLIGHGADVTMGQCDTQYMNARCSCHTSSLYKIARYGSAALLKDAIAAISPKASVKLYASDIISGAAGASDTSNLSFVFELLGKDATRGDILRDALSIAIEKGRTEAVKLLIAKGADVNFTSDFSEFSAQDLAAQHDNSEILSLLFDNGAEFSMPADIRAYPLLKISEKSSYEAVRTLVEHGANVNMQPKGSVAPLAMAVESGNYRIVELLVKHGANVNVTPARGGNLLHLAAESGNPKIISLLLTKGLDINERNRMGYLPVLYAAIYANRPAFKKLLASHDETERPKLLDAALALALSGKCHGNMAEFILENYDSLAKYDGKATTNAIEYTQQFQKQLDQQQKAMDSNNPPLFRFFEKWRSGKCDLSELKKISKKDLRLNEILPHGAGHKSTALEYLFDWCYPLDHSLLHGIIAYLLENGADPNIGTPIVKAIEKGELEMALQMLDSCKSLDNKKLYHKIMLDLAAAGRMDVAKRIEKLCPKDDATMKTAENHLRELAFYGYPAEMQRLIDYTGVDVNCRNEYGDSPLFFALENGSSSAAMFLIEHGADINAKGSGNETPLHSAARFDIGLVKYLVEHGLDVNARNERGATPLHHAIVFGRLDIADYLITSGADITKAAPDGSPLFVCAAYSCSARVLEYLVKKGVDYKAKDKNGTNAMQIATALNPNANAIEYLASLGLAKPSEEELIKTLRLYADTDHLRRPGVFEHQDVNIRICDEIMRYD